MRVTSLAAVAIACGLTLGCGGHHAAPPVDPATAPAVTPKAIVAAAKQTIESWRQAYEVRSLDTLEKLYQHDLDVALVEQGATLLGWSSVDAKLKDTISRAKEIHIRLNDVHVSALGPDVAAAVATMTREVTDGVQAVSEHGTVTFVLHKVGDTWLIAAEHYSYRQGS